MRQIQNIIASPSLQTPVNHFENIVGKTEEKADDATEPLVTMRCEICPETQTATRSQLDGFGWGDYGSFTFCPTHEAMI